MIGGCNTTVIDKNFTFNKQIILFLKNQVYKKYINNIKSNSMKNYFEPAFNLLFIYLFYQSDFIISSEHKYIKF